VVEGRVKKQCSQTYILSIVTNKGSYSKQCALSHVKNGIQILLYVVMFHLKLHSYLYSNYISLN
jgi:hypothetical protein